MTNVDVELIKYDVAEDSIFEDSNTNTKKNWKPGLLSEIKFLIIQFLMVIQIQKVKRKF